MFIDTHSHLDDEQYNNDREEVIKRAIDDGIEKIINVSFDLVSAKRAVDLAQKYEHIFVAVGCHPTTQEESGYVFNKNDFLAMAQQPKVVAIGECGLELKNPEDLVNQQEIFEAQIDLAKELDLPLIVHCRDAHKEVIEILAKAGQTRGVIHCFSGSWQTAQKYLEMGFYLSFNGIITYASDYDKVVKNMPLDRLLLETDCPYLSPAPFRGQRNEPAYVKHAAQRVAEIRGEAIEKIAQVTTQNARDLFVL
ncbi:MAG: TatD family hydrolase [Candidatus Gribaldobacteria bacterium]|nr:TatD family hydrolase [Candidatus Gribaldobacteria bacterium]